MNIFAEIRNKKIACIFTSLLPLFLCICTIIFSQVLNSYYFERIVIPDNLPSNYSYSSIKYKTYYQIFLTEVIEEYVSVDNKIIITHLVDGDLQDLFEVNRDKFIHDFCIRKKDSSYEEKRDLKICRYPEENNGQDQYLITYEDKYLIKISYEKTESSKEDIDYIISTFRLVPYNNSKEFFNKYEYENKRKLYEYIAPFLFN